MSKWLRPLRAPSVLLPAFAVLCLALVGLTYYLFWVRAQSEEFDDRAFRRIAGASDTISAELELYRSVLDRAWTGSLPGTRQPGGQRFSDFLSSEVPTLKSPCPGLGSASNSKQGSAETVQKSGNLTLVTATEVSGCVKVITIATKAIGQFPADLFDEIIIGSDTGEVLFQTARTGLRVTDLTSIYPKEHDLVFPNGRPDGKPARIQADNGDISKEDPFTDAKEHSSLGHLSIAGGDYRVYLVPVVKGIRDVAALQIPQSDSGANTIPVQDPQLFVAGLVKNSRFRTTIFSPPRNMTIWALLVLLWTLIGVWPPIRLISTQSSQRIRRRTVLSIVVMNSAAGVVLGLIIAHGSDAGLDDSTEKKLMRLVNQVQINVDHEVRDILDMSCTGMQNLTSGELKYEQLKYPALFSKYPYFEHLEVDSSQGVQLAKLTLRPHATPRVPVTDYRFFKAATENQFWSLNEDRAYQKFRIDPIYSPTTGQYLAVVSRPAITHECAQTPSWFSGPEPAFLLSTVTPLISLTEPILPPDFGFMILDRDGTVLFHSDSALNQRENFFDETGSQKVRESINKGLTTYEAGTYHGEKARFYSRPIDLWQDCPWTIVSFRTSALLESRHVETMLLSVTLLLIYSAMLVFLLTIFSRWALPKSLTAIRPRKSLAGVYRSILFGNLVLLAACILFSVQGTDLALLVAAVSVPFGITLCTWRLLRGVRRGVVVYILGSGLVLCPFVLRLFLQHGYGGLIPLPLGVMAVLIAMPMLDSAQSTVRGRRIFPIPEGMESVLALYAKVATLLLFVISAITSLCLYQASFEYVQVLFREQEMLSEYVLFQQRAQKVQASFTGISFGDAHQSEATERNLAIKRRLDLSLDQYQDALNWQLDPQRRIPSLAHDQLLDRTLSSLVRFNVWLDDPSATTMRLLASRRIPFNANSKLCADLCSGQTEPGEWRLTWWDPTRQADVLSAFNRSTFLPVTLWAYLQPSSAEYLAKEASGIWLFSATLAVLGLAYVKIRFTVSRLFASDMVSASKLRVFGAADIVANSVVFTPDGLFRNKDAIDSLNLRNAKHIDCALSVDDFARVRDEVSRELGDGKPVTLFSTQMPADLLDEMASMSESAEESIKVKGEAERWRQHIEPFLCKRRIQEELVTSGSDAIEAYSAIWANATQNQRIVLFQLAHDGMVNPRVVRVMNDLFEKGIIERRDDLVVLFADFQSYIRQTIPAEVAEQWQRDDSSSSWVGLRSAFVVLALAILVVGLLFAQQEFLAAIVGGLAPILPLINGLLKSDKEEGKE